jgi:ethanolamine ammonia-lyase small subunit
MAKDEPTITVANPWAHLRKNTPARIALGRTGVSLPTSEHLKFQLAHARARSAVHHSMDVRKLAEDLSRFGSVLEVESAAVDRPVYLQRPDLGRQLSRASAERLSAGIKGPFDVAYVVADGLSAFAIEKNIVPFLEAMLPVSDNSGWSRAPLILAKQARVALGDEIGALIGAKIVVMLIGERPGLSSPDSLGIYLTYSPRVGLTDADRNCISNVRGEGLSYAEASYKLHYLIGEALKRQISGVNLKDEAEALPKPEGGPRPNFLLDAPKD